MGEALYSVKQQFTGLTQAASPMELSGISKNGKYFHRRGAEAQRKSHMLSSRPTGEIS
jgi:hypothetical protein